MYLFIQLVSYSPHSLMDGTEFGFCKKRPADGKRDREESEMRICSICLKNIPRERAAGNDPENQANSTQEVLGGSPGGSVVKTLPANAGERGSVSDPGWPHMPWSNQASVPPLLSLYSRAQEPQLQKPTCRNYESPWDQEHILPNKRSHRNEMPEHDN